jgi:glycerol transport system ATP-binding protein
MGWAEYGTIGALQRIVQGLDFLLELKNLQIAKDREPLNYDLGAGELGVVLGRNHSGKTQLARTLAGLEEPFGGRLLLDGQDITGCSPGQRSVALVYQAFVNYPNFTVAENIASPLRARGERSSKRVARLVDEIADQLGLRDMLRRFPDQLSGGQQQRVAIARALAKAPRLLVLDEPLVNLDLKLRESFAVELRELMHRQGTAALYTTTDPREAFNLGDSVLLLENHQRVQAGTPLELYLHPASEAAADLMSDPGVNVWLNAGVRHAVRPEELDLQPGAASDVKFAVRLLSTETNGQETFLHVQTDSGAHWVARVAGLPVGLREGAELSLFAPADAVMRFAEPVQGAARG